MNYLTLSIFLLYLVLLLISVYLVYNIYYLKQAEKCDKHLDKSAENFRKTSIFITSIILFLLIIILFVISFLLLFYRKRIFFMYNEAKEMGIFDMPEKKKMRNLLSIFMETP